LDAGRTAEETPDHVAGGSRPLEAIQQFRGLRLRAGDATRPELDRDYATRLLDWY